MIEPLYEEWLKHTRTDSELHEELLSVKGDAKAASCPSGREGFAAFWGQAPTA